MTSFYNNKINYKKFINHLCDYKALELNLNIQQIVLNLFLSNFRFLSLSNNNGLYFLRYDLLKLPENTIFLKKSGLARAQLNQLNDKYDHSLVSVDYRSFQYLSGIKLPYSDKKEHYINTKSLLRSTRGLQVSWNDGTLLKHLLVWEHVYAPGLLLLKGFSTWHVFFMKEREWFFFSSWARRDVNYILMLILISRGFSKIFNHYMPDYVISELEEFLKREGPLSKMKSHLIPFYMWIFDMLRWSSILAGGEYTPKKIILEENNTLKIKEYLFEKDIINFGGWMQSHKNFLINEVRYWVYPEVDEFKNEELFHELIEMEDVYDSDIIDDDAFISNTDIFVWPWAKFWNQYYALDFVKSKKFFAEVNDIDEHKLLLSFYFSVKDSDKRLQSTPTSNDLLNYFEQTFKATAWDDVLKWFHFFYPKTFNTVQLIGFNRYPLLLIISTFISRLNGLFLYGFQGFDRRNIFFRLFFLCVLKYRGLFFKFFSILLKRISYRLPWEEELNYILHILEQDQIFFQDVCKKKLYTHFYLTDHLVKVRQQGNYPFLHFFQYFFTYHWDSHIRQKRQELYPDFLQTVESLLFKEPSLLRKYTTKVLINVYLAILKDFLKNPMVFVKYLRFYEAKYDNGMPFVFNVNLKNYGEHHKGGSYYKFFQYRKKFKILLKKTIYKSSTKSYHLNKFSFQKNFQLPSSFIFKPTGGTILNLFIQTYKQFYIYLFKVFVDFLRNIIIFFLSGFISGTAYHLSGYFLKFFNPYINNWPLYKDEVRNVFHIALRKELKHKEVLKIRRLFFYRWWHYLSNFREVFNIKSLFLFFAEVCWFYIIHALHRLSLNLYKFFWYRVFLYKRWIWRIKNTAKLRFYDWSPDLDYSIMRGISKEHKIIRARYKAQAKDEDYQPTIVKYLAEKIHETRSPFENHVWKEIHLWLVSLFFYRKLRRKSIVYKRELTYMFGLYNSNLVVKFILNFKFWSFFFTYIYLFLIRSICLTVIFFIFSVCSSIINVLSWFRIVYDTYSISSYIWLFWLQLIVLLYSLLYGLFFLTFYTLLTICFLATLSYKIIKWTLLSSVLIIKKLGLLVLVKPFLMFFVWIRLMMYDLLLIIKFNFYWVLIFLLNWWSFVRFITILTLGFILFLTITVLYLFKGLLFDKRVRKDYSSTLFFFFKEESSIFYYDFKDFFFFLSFFLKFFCLIISFFMFVLGQMGWKLVKFIFGEGYESDALKIKPELPTKKVFQFLDVYVWFFFYILKDFSLTKPNFFFFVVYSICLEVVSWFLYFINAVAFICVFLYYFIVDLICKTHLGCVLVKKSIKTIKIIRFYLGFIYSIFLNLSSNIKSVIETNKIKRSNMKNKFFKMSLIKLFFLRVLLVFVYGKNTKISMKVFKLLFKASKRWSKLFENFFKQLEEQGLNIKRELQEVVVFISIIYEFSTFYWSYIQKLSIEVGELGWWLSYYDRTRTKIYNTLSKKEYSFFILNKMYKNKLNFFSKHHSYYLHMNSTFRAIQRYRPYIINSIYAEKNQSAYGSSSKIFSKGFFKFGSLFKKIGSFLGFSFLFEILFLRFQQPISLFLFGNKKKIFPAHVLIRLKYFKDFFNEFNWLLRFTYDAHIKGTDHFFIRFLPKFVNDLNIKKDYLQKHRVNWFYKIFTSLTPRVVDLLPKFRWDYLKLLTGLIRWSFNLIFFTTGLMIFIAVISFAIHFSLFFLLFCFCKFIIFMAWSLFKRYWWLIVLSSVFFLLLILYTLGFIFF